MTVQVVPPSDASVFRETTLVYLDGEIDADAPRRLSTVLTRVSGRVAVWLNSPGGNLFAGMQLGRLIRTRRASTHIVNARTLLPGECYSACALAFLGGYYRFSDSGSSYGVHRASLSTSSASGNLDLGQHLSGAIESYIREMGVDLRLLALWMKAAPDEMYVLSRREVEDLGVVNDGRRRPEWKVSTFPGGTALEGRQATIDGTGSVSFSCDHKQIIFGSVYDGPGQDGLVTAQKWSHVLTIDGQQEYPLQAVSLSHRDRVVRSTFVLPTVAVRRLMSARRVGHVMNTASGPAFSLGYSIDIDAKSASAVRTFLGKCLRSVARAAR